MTRTNRVWNMVGVVGTGKVRKNTVRRFVACESSCAGQRRNTSHTDAAGSTTTPTPSTDKLSADAARTWYGRPGSCTSRDTSLWFNECRNTKPCSTSSSCRKICRKLVQFNSIKCFFWPMLNHSMELMFKYLRDCVHKMSTCNLHIFDIPKHGSQISSEHAIKSKNAWSRRHF